jgi:hypothetical protein
MVEVKLCKDTKDIGIFTGSDISQLSEWHTLFKYVVPNSAYFVFPDWKAFRRSTQHVIFGVATIWPTVLIA